jgi:hypothetical protein
LASSRRLHPNVVSSCVRGRGDAGAERSFRCSSGSMKLRMDEVASQRKRSNDVAHRNLGLGTKPWGLSGKGSQIEPKLA